jgi:hypothetical protein
MHACEVKDVTRTVVAVLTLTDLLMMGILIMVLLMKFHEYIKRILDSSVLGFLQFFVLLRGMHVRNRSSEGLNLCIALGTFTSSILGECPVVIGSLGNLLC